jgi:hypothetical protein
MKTMKDRFFVNIISINIILHDLIMQKLLIALFVLGISLPSFAQLNEEDIIGS